MADFINIETFEIIRGHTPDLVKNPKLYPYKFYDEDGKLVNGPAMPTCDRKHWKWNGEKVVAMTTAEKAAKDTEIAAAARASKPYEKIMDEILGSFTGADLEKVLDNLSSQFDAGLRLRKFDICRSRLAKALQAGKLTQTMHDTIKNILPE